MPKFLPTFFALLLLGAAASLRAQPLLIVDDSNPAAVTLTATGAFPDVSNSTFTTYDGVSLLEFFTSTLTETDNGTVTGDLLAHGASEAYDTWSVDNSSGSTLVDLSPYYGTEAGASTQSFDSSAPAFTGVTFIDLSSYAADLPGPGVTGNLVAGYTFNGAGPGFSPVLGEWEVVPEPAAAARWAGLAALAGVLAWQGRSRRIRA